MTRKSLIIGIGSLPLILFGLLSLIRIGLWAVEPLKGINPRILCRTNIGAFGMAMKSRISRLDDKFRFEPNWCDILHDEEDIPFDDFVCWEAKTKPSSYAMNKNIIGLAAAPNDVVVIFDSKPGWNLVGGPELLAPENHKGKGCNILFGNFEAKFVPKEEIKNLKWTVDANQYGHYK